jgi:hypothetical protein
MYVYIHKMKNIIASLSNYIWMLRARTTTTTTTKRRNEREREKKERKKRNGTKMATRTEI